MSNDKAETVKAPMKAICHHFFVTLGGVDLEEFDAVDRPIILSRRWG